MDVWSFYVGGDDGDGGDGGDDGDGDGDGDGGGGGDGTANGAAGAASGIVAMDLAKCGLTADSLAVLLKVPVLQELVLFGNDLFIGFTEAMEDPAVFKAAAALVDLDLAARDTACTSVHLLTYIPTCLHLL